MRDIWDVVIVGGGIAGCAAAVSATELGADVLLVEKQSALGGSTIMSGGFLALAETPVQEALGIEDSTELLFDDLRAVAGYHNDEFLVRAYVDGQRDLFDWLVHHGTLFREHVEVNSGQSAPHSHQVDTQVMLDGLLESARSTGRLEIWTNAPVLSLETSDGSVTGVVVDHPGGVRTVSARGGVALTSGGFARSVEMLERFAPGQRLAMPHGGAGSTGDGLRIATAVGAATRDMEHVKGTFGTHPETGPDQHEMLLAFYDGAIIVNVEGRRFVDESISYKLLGDACLAQPRQLGFQVFDAKVMSRSVAGVRTHDYAAALSRGLLLAATTLEELAVKAGLDPKQLIETITTYNLDVTAGLDRQFGRDGRCHHVGALEPIETSPFYCYPTRPVIQATYGGLAVSSLGEVLRDDGTPIEGLFAAGEITGGFHGSAYMTGSSLGKGALFGRIVGEQAARRSGMPTDTPG